VSLRRGRTKQNRTGFTAANPLVTSRAIFGITGDQPFLNYCPIKQYRSLHGSWRLNAGDTPILSLLALLTIFNVFQLYAAQQTLNTLSLAMQNSEKLKWLHYMELKFTESDVITEYCLLLKSASSVIQISSFHIT
jgi:hypothetical protein